jgi:hypothetical protein
MFPWHDGLCECSHVAKTVDEYERIDLLARLGVKHNIKKEEVVPGAGIVQEVFGDLSQELFKGLSAINLQQQLNHIREQADKMGLAIVVSWHGEYGVPESVTLQSTDRISIGIKQ